MAKNPNPKHKARHTLFVATTGGGKTTAVHQSPQIRKANRVVIFDPYNAYDKLGRKGVVKTYSIKQFAVTLHKAMNQKKPFVVALCGMSGVGVLDLFSKVVWSAADGNKELHVVVEELIGSVPSPNKLQKQVAELWNGGRQFGLVMYSLFQRAQEVPKTVTRQSQFKWVGKQDSKADCRYWSNEIDVSDVDINSLIDLEYYFKESGKDAVRGRLKPYSKKS